MKKSKNKRFNVYDEGGFKWDKKLSFGDNMKSGFKSGAFNLAMGAVGNTAGQLIGGNLLSGAGNLMLGAAGVASAIPGPWGAAAGAILSTTGGVVNRLFGSNINEQAVQEFKNLNQLQMNRLFDASNTDDLLAQSDFDLLGHINKSEVGSDGLFSHKASRTTRRLNRERELANLYAFANFNNSVNNVDAQNDFMAIKNSVAYGGPINMRYSGFMSPFGNRFNAGGPLQSYGADWTNGVISVNEGGTHELNPYGGVPMGTDLNGTPNVVEEGEKIWNDYVFSNRLLPTELMRKKYKLKGKTFADIAENILKESKERPNDPISKRGLESALTLLRDLQESIRLKKASLEEAELMTNNNAFDSGGYKPDAQGMFSTFDLSKPLELKLDGNIKSPLDIKLTEPLSFIDNSTQYSSSPLRYAPVAGNLGALVHNILTKPDYGTGKSLMEKASDVMKYKPVTHRNVGTYMLYNPLDINYIYSKANALNNAARRAILDSAGGSRAAAMAGLSAQGYASQAALADAFMKMDEANEAKRNRALEFNNKLDMYNSDGAFKAAITNSEQHAKAKALSADLLTKGLTSMDAEDAARSAAIANEYSNLFENLGGIGREGFAMDMVRNNPALLYDWMGNYKSKKAKNGGYLTIKKKK